MKAVTYAPEAWKYLNGVFCVYKPSKTNIYGVRHSIALNLCKDLNDMEKRPPRDRVLLNGSVSSGKPFSVECVPNYADHELVSGPRYQTQDIRLRWIKNMGSEPSGILLMTINDGCKFVDVLETSNYLRKYEVKGKFGCASDTFMADGKIRERSTYSHIRQSSLDRLLASIQSCNQALSYRYSKLDIHSQAAYELASKGLIRPSGKTDPIIYGIRCIDFNLPGFTLEIQCINETDTYLAELVHQIGVYLKSSAVCVQLRRTQFGYFTLEHALLRKHWTLEHILNNITLCKQILGKDSYVPSTAHFEPIKVARLKEALEEMQKDARDDIL
ncbi:mitochondrial mRNA pseudouridine synthase Trub2 [Trichonephila clavipes]|nr:mitochondrial mRNA pseudouridine synthase Trub2 [Trichonephila clavipes]